MNLKEAQKFVASENGKKSVEARKKKYGDMSAHMKDIRGGGNNNKRNKKKKVSSS